MSVSRVENPKTSLISMRNVLKQLFETLAHKSQPQLQFLTAVQMDMKTADFSLLFQKTVAKVITSPEEPLLVAIGEHFQSEFDDVILQALINSQVYIHLHIVGVSKERFELLLTKVNEKRQLEGKIFITIDVLTEYANEYHPHLLQQQSLDRNYFEYLSSFYQAVLNRIDRSIFAIVGLAFSRLHLLDLVNAKTYFTEIIAHEDGIHLSSIAHFYLCYIALLEKNNEIAQKHINILGLSKPEVAYGLQRMMTEENLSPYTFQLLLSVYPWKEFEGFIEKNTTPESRKPPLLQLPQIAYQYIHQAKNAELNGKIEEAISLSQQAIATFPYLPFYLNLAKLQSTKSEFLSVLETIDAGIKNYKNSPVDPLGQYNNTIWKNFVAKCYQLRAQNFIYLHQYALALNDLHQFEKFNQNLSCDKYPAKMQIETLLRLGEYESCLEQNIKFVKLNKLSIDEFLYYAVIQIRCLIGLNQYDEALQFFMEQLTSLKTSAVELANSHPKNFGNLINLGSYLFLFKNQYELAIQYACMSTGIPLARVIIFIAEHAKNNHKKDTGRAEYAFNHFIEPIFLTLNQIKDLTGIEPHIDLLESFLPVLNKGKYYELSLKIINILQLRSPGRLATNKELAKVCMLALLESDAQLTKAIIQQDNHGILRQSLFEIMLSNTEELLGISSKIGFHSFDLAQVNTYRHSLPKFIHMVLSQFTNNFELKEYLNHVIKGLVAKRLVKPDPILEHLIGVCLQYKNEKVSSIDLMADLTAPDENLLQELSKTCDESLISPTNETYKALTPSAQNFINDIKNLIQAQGTILPFGAPIELRDIPHDVFRVQLINALKLFSTTKTEPVVIVYGDKWDKDLDLLALKSFATSNIHIKLHLTNVNSERANDILNKLELIAAHQDECNISLTLSPLDILDFPTLQRAMTLAGESSQYFENLLFVSTKLDGFGKSYHSLFDLAYANFHLKNFEKAKCYFSELINLNTAVDIFSISHYFLFYLASQNKDWNQARKCLQIYATTHETEANALLKLLPRIKKGDLLIENLAKPYCIRPWFESKLNLISLLGQVEEKPKTPIQSAFSDAANSHLTSDPEEKIRLLSKAIATYPYLQFYINLANVYIQEKNFVKALEQCNKAIEFHQQHYIDPLERFSSKLWQLLIFSAYQLRITCQEALYQYKDMMTSLLHFEKNFPLEFVNYCAFKKISSEALFAENFLRSGDYAECIRYTDKILNTRIYCEDFILGNTLKIQALIFQGNLEEANQVFQHVLTTLRSTFQARNLNTNELLVLKKHHLILSLAGLLAFLNNNYRLAFSYLEAKSDTFIGQLFLYLLHAHLKQKKQNSINEEEIFSKHIDPIINFINKTENHHHCVEHLHLVFICLNHMGFYESSFKILEAMSEFYPGYEATKLLISELIETVVRNQDWALASKISLSKTIDFVKIGFSILSRNKIYDEHSLQLLTFLLDKMHDNFEAMDHFLQQPRTNSPIEKQMLAKTFLFKANYFIQHSKTEQAISRWEEVLKLTPDCQIALLGLGSIYFQMQKYDLALFYLQRVNETSPHLQLKMTLCQLAIIDVGSYNNVLDNLHPGLQPLQICFQEILSNNLSQLSLFEDVLEQLNEITHGAVADIYFIASRLCSTNNNNFAIELIDVALEKHNKHKPALALRKKLAQANTQFTLREETLASTEENIIEELINDAFNQMAGEEIAIVDCESALLQECLEDVATEALSEYRLSFSTSTFFRPASPPSSTERSNSTSPPINVSSEIPFIQQIDIPLQDQAKELYQLLKTAGKTLIVGGYIRDYFLSQPADDCDFAICLPIQKLKLHLDQLIEANKLPKGCYTIHGRKNQSIEMVLNGKKFDLTSIRMNDDGNLHEAYYQNTLSRDITINALIYDPERQEVFDFHHGIEHLLAKKVKFISDIEDCCVRNPLRLMRSIRCAHKYQLSFDESDIQFIKTNTGLILSIDYEQRIKEFQKWIDKFGLEGAQQLLQVWGLDKYIAPPRDMTNKSPRSP